MRRLFGQDSTGVKTADDSFDLNSALTNGALDTLGSVFQTFGDEAFPLDTDIDPFVFQRQCAEFVRHIENGEGVPSRNLPRSTNGDRNWPLLRQVFSERRRAEKSFVVERIGNYRELVDDLISGLRGISERDQSTELSVTQSLQHIESAIQTGEISTIRSVLRETMESVSATFETQKQAYERQLQELNDRMGNLRQDLVSAREEMKRDSLTDAYNRGAFDAALQQSLNMHFMLQQPITLVLIDLDKFKEINDQYGHATGDQALRMIGECLARAFIRKSDLVARYGGDEFAVILSDTNRTSAKRLVERFVENVAKAEIPASGGSIRLTCSVGYTELVDDDSAESVIARADRGLYAVKARGGNAADYAEAATADR